MASANTLLGGSPSAGVELRSQQPAGSAVRFVGHPDEVAEAAFVADQIAALQRRGTSPGQVAVLFRINAQSEHFEDALSDRGIPYVVRGAARFFERPEVREAVVRLRGAARSGETADLPWLEAVRGVLGGMGWNADPPTGRGQVRDRWESWQALVTQAEEFAAEHADADLTAFVADLDRRVAEQHAPAADGVTLATFHAAKGLEWDAVFCAGVQDGTVPITYADRDATVEEERRLLYVGVTRARRDLTVTWSAARNPGQAARRQPSRFLAPLLPEGEKPQPGGRSRSKVARCRECSQPLGTAAEKKRGRCAVHPVRYDEGLFERLKAWRLERARDDEVPAYVVFTDATLELIAEHKPVDEKALRAISGVGPSKIERYAEAVLAVVTEAS